MKHQKPTTITKTIEVHLCTHAKKLIAIEILVE